MFNWIKKFFRVSQGFLERHLIGIFFHRLAWRFRHLYVKDWSSSYLNSIDDIHRVQISKAIVSYRNVNSVLDVGCASGANIANLRRQLPKARLVGIDINPSGIKSAKNYFSQLHDHNVYFHVKDLTRLTEYADNSFDVVLTDAVLMFVPPKYIGQVINDFIRISRQGVVLNEFHDPDILNGFFDGGRWVHNYISLFQKFSPNAKIEIEKATLVGGSWDKYGSLIKVSI